MLQRTTFELIVVDGKSESSRVVHLKNVYRPQSFASGLEGALMRAFDAMLSDGISHVNVTTSLVVRSANIEHLVQVDDPTLLFMKGQNCSFDAYKKARGKNADLLLSVINLLGWKFAPSEERFCVGGIPLVSRACILCGHTQVCERRIEPPCTVNNIWPSDFCTNSSCFSHEIQRQIIPNYEIPVITRPQTGLFT